ncbi:uncharacterized protein [Watersipora subatra]|uniref:uncharacterized protein n=1 Tax=Watersipora subatra TaxID=2589382 RepID=UPI00355BF4E9
MQVFGKHSYAQIQQLREELLSARKSNKMKDDTIAFLQREKENLVKEVKHYETICAGVENDIALQQRYEQELKNLRTDIQHWKEVVKRHKHARKSITRENTMLDQGHKELIDEINSNLNILLSDIPTETSASIKRQLVEIIEHAEHETSWNLLQVTSKALIEIQAHVNKYKLAFESATKRPVMRYSHTPGEPIPHSQPTRSAMSRLVKHSLSSTRRSSLESNTRAQSAADNQEFRTIPGFLPGLKKYNNSS